jgi:hypothetical protein
VELVNPQKTLMATLPSGTGSERGGGVGPLTYRYAPLSAGLDIIRKALGGQEIALLQTTHVEQGHGAAEGGMLVLTTTLAHSSGEWVATTWPVCRLGDVADPKLLGAALTYARRYSLFALVGITGDDDLDAPELGGREADRQDVSARKTSWSAPALSLPIKRRHQPLSRVRRRVVRATLAQAPSGTPAGPPPSEQSDLSVSVLLVGLAAVQDEMGLLTWARDALSLRAELKEPDAVALNQAFLRRAEAIGADPELMSAFAPSQEVSESELNPHPATTPPRPGGHDAQATF